MVKTYSVRAFSDLFFDRAWEKVQIKYSNSYGLEKDSF